MKKQRLWIGIGFVLVVVLAFVLLFAPIEKEQKGVKVGAILPLTGNVGIFGEWIKNGIELGLDDINSKYPELKDKIKIVFEDSQNNPKLGISALNKLLTVDQVDVVIVGMSRVAIPIIPITEKKRIPLLLQDVTYPNITKKGNMIFRHFIQSDREAAILSEYASQTLGVKSVAILYVNDEAGLGAKEAFHRSFSEFGDVLIEESYEVTETDMRTHITKILNKNPQAIFLFGNGPSWAIGLKQLRELGYNGIVLTNTAMYIPNFRQMAGPESIEGVYFTYPFMDMTHPTVEKFVDSYKEKYEEFPPIEAAYGYDLVQYIASALKSGVGKNIYEKLLSVNTLEGAFGSIRIDKDRDIKTKVAIAIIREDKIKNLQIISSD